MRTPFPPTLARALALASLVAGCFADPPPDAPDAAPDARPPADASPDVAPKDAPDDLTADAPEDASPPPDAMDDVAPDVAPDAAPDAPPDVVMDVFRCAADADCADPSTPHCQAATGRCVACLGAVDCPRAQHCEADTGACASGCRADDDCRRGAEDGGLPARCDLARGACVECMGDDECPLRTICTDGQCVPGCNERRGCSSGETCCSNLCVDLQRDVAHCGACGARCQAANGVPACAAGRCAIDACTAGFANCNGDVGDGCEVNLSSDGRNCGRCGTACDEAPNAAVACAAGRCGFSCRAGYADCDGAGANGCERITSADPAHCGRCNNACPTPAGAAAPLCGMGSCAFSCTAGMANCDGDPANGCEVDTRTTVAHCGGCSNACLDRPHSTNACDAGRCLLRCDAGWGDCNNDPSDGCETDLTTSIEHCNRCGARCAVPGGAAACVRGACVVASCGADFADCDGSAGNGCESDLRSSAANCARCGNACPARPNAAPACEARACTARCNAGFADCNGTAGDGCEVDTRVTVTSCGACGRACAVPNGTAGCAGGACAVAGCNDGFGNCDGDASNGCETNLATTPAHCGACGVRAVEQCDGRDNTCDGRVDEGCPTALTGLDVIDFTSPTYGSGSGTAYDVSCPAGTFITGVSGRLYANYYQTQWLFRCARPRLVEDRTRTPFAYSIAWDAAGTAGPGGSPTAYTQYVFDCPAGSVLHRVQPYFSGAIMGQTTFECASWAVAGTPATGWRLTRTVTRSAAYGRVYGTQSNYLCPDEAGSASAMRAFFGRYNTSLIPTITSAAFRCTAPNFAVR
ncbi:MAG: hypothetical protein U0324_45240 [Polyangiales bacterium]